MTDEQRQKAISGCLADCRYLDKDRGRRVAALSGLLLNAFVRKGQEGGRSEDLAVALDREIADYMGYQLTFSEACLAIEWGLHGEFGEYTGLNVERLFRFVRSYLESDARQYALKTARWKMEAPSVTTREDAARLNWESISDYTLERWREYMETGSLRSLRTEEPGAIDTGAVLAGRVCCMYSYQWLKAVGIVARDSQTARTEAEKERRAMAALRAKDPGFAVKAYAGAMMLLEVFVNADAAGMDLGEELAGIGKETPITERRFWI